MKRKSQRITGHPSFEIIEEGVHLLRDLPLAAYLPYWTGVLPFLAAMLYFLADMSQGAQAQVNCAPGAMAVAFFFIWMKTWQAVFVSRLREHLSGIPGEIWTMGRWWRAFCQQAALQPTGFLILPLAAMITLPFGWVVAFYHSLSWTGDGQKEGIRSLFRRTVRLTAQWPGQNHMVLLWLSFFAFFVLFNVLLMFHFVPSLLKVFLGMESTWTRGGWSLMNTTIMGACVSVAWVCLDPLFKAVYALRCFYGEAVTTGEDLRAEIRALPKLAKGVALLILGCLLVSPMPAAHAAEATPAQSPEQVQKLDRAIEEVLNQRRYEWRLPPDETFLEEDSAGGWIQKVLREVQGGLVRAIKATVKQVERFIDWVADFFPKKKAKPAEAKESGVDWMGGLRILLFLLLAAVAAALAVFFWRVWRKQQSSNVVIAQAVLARPDLTDENITAADLPENEWLAMAREQMAAGNFRLALRAMYLAGLAHLGEREILKITRFKSNQDYVRELARRARSKPELQTVFGDAVLDFERVWYGLHEVGPEAVERYQRNVERILAC